MTKLTYNKDKEELTESLGAKTMNQLDTVLSPTEKETSEIIPLGKEISLLGIFHKLERKHLEFYAEGVKELQRIILEDENIIKLESKDNGTPVVYVIDTKRIDLRELESKLTVFCKYHHLKFRKIES